MKSETVTIRMVVRLGQALLPNLNNVAVGGTHLWGPLSYLHCYYPQFD